MNTMNISNWRDWGGPVTMDGLVLALALLLLLTALVALWWRGNHPSQREPGMDASNRFSSHPPITDEQVALLRYLQRAFPDGAVLFRPRLSYFMNVRAGRDRSEARRWLSMRRVDFLLCADDGKPLYAFEVDSLHDHEDRHAQRRLAEKNRALRTAGIRLIRFKGALASWPPPEVLRERVMAAARPAPMNTGFGDSGFAPSGFSTSTGYENSGFANSGHAASSGFQASQPGSSQGPYSGVMSLTDLMRLQPANEDDPWSSVRKRS